MLQKITEKTVGTEQVRVEYVDTPIVITTVSEYKEYLLKKWKEKVSLLMDKPRVEVTLPRDVPLVINVDGGRINKDDFREKYEDMASAVLDTDGVTVLTPEETTTVKDADNNFIPNITKSEMFLIYKAIFKNGEALYQAKWVKEAEINACTTIVECEAIVL